MQTAAENHAAEPMLGYPTAPMRLETGHWCRPVLACLGHYMVEVAPGENVYVFSHDPVAVEIIAKHNRLYRRRHRAAVKAAAAADSTGNSTPATGAPD